MGSMGCLPSVVPPSEDDGVGQDASGGLDASLDAGEVEDTAAPACEDAPGCTEEGAFCGGGSRDRYFCITNDEGCLVRARGECELGLVCDDGACVDCTDDACAGYEVDQILYCVPSTEDDVARYGSCRRDRTTGCLMPRVQTCSAGQACVLGGPFDDPCVDPLDG